jgi:hypothetical protein
LSLVWNRVKPQKDGVQACHILRRLKRFCASFNEFSKPVCVVCSVTKVAKSCHQILRNWCEKLWEPCSS